MAPSVQAADRPDIRDGDGWIASVVIPHISGHSRVREFAQDNAVAISKRDRWEFIAWAESEVKSNPPVNSQYSYTSTSDITLNRPNLVSILWTNESDTGGEHPTESYDCCSVGLVHGKPKILALSDLFRPGVDVRATAGRAIVDTLAKDPDAADIQNGRLTPNTPGLVGQFFLGESAITFVISSDIAARYAIDGVRLVKVSYADLDGIDPAGPLAPVLKH